MKFEIILKDFWLDDDEELEPSLKSYISEKIIDGIFKSIEKKVETQITMQVKEQVEKTLYQKIGTIIDIVINTEKINDGYSNHKITIEDYIKKQFTENTKYHSPKEKIEQLAEDCAKELKERYDLIFASHIVAKINEQGMLKEDIAKLLLENSKK